MTMPTPLCPHRMQVHDIRQETPDVWTLSLICPDFYPYLAGQHALVSIGNSAETLRAYTLSSTPGLSPFITLTVRRVHGGIGSNWLTRDVKRGDYLWLSAAQGDFTLQANPDNRYLLLAAGCGVTPIIAMRRWLAHHQPDADVEVIYSAHTPQDLIFAEEWRRYPVTLMATESYVPGILNGRLTRERLSAVPDLASRTVLTCGPASYMEFVEQTVRELGVTKFASEHFYVPEVVPVGGAMLKFSKMTPVMHFQAPVGSTLLAAMESNNVPIVAACRAGACGCCKTKVVDGQYTVTSTTTLTAQEIADGYVLACSCHPQSDLVLA